MSSYQSLMIGARIPRGEMRQRPCAALWLMACAILFLGVRAPAATFEEQREAMTDSMGTQPEAAVLSLLQAGLAEGKGVVVYAKAREWLKQNQPSNALLYYYAGRGADLSGDWKDAVLLYQNYLKGADLKSDTADEAVYAVYSMLIDQLQDSEGAYTFSRKMGDRLLACPRARQFDRWYLDKAVSKDDVEAVANRLLACVEAGVSQDDLAVYYDDYFHWLLGVLDGVIEDTAGLSVNKSLAETCRKLAAGVTFSEDLRLRLAWAAAVRYYNQARIQGEDVSPPLDEAKALLAKDPRYAKWVQDGWAGGDRAGGRKQQDKYWSHAIDAKMAPVVAAAQKLAPLELAELLESWRVGYYDGGPYVQAVKAVSSLLSANPKWVNSRTGVVPFAKPLNQMTPEDARRLAPQVDQVAELSASYVRSIAAGNGKNFDQGMAALLGPEAWRLPANIEIGGLREFDDFTAALGANLGGRRNKAREKVESMLKAFSSKISKEIVAKGAPQDERVAAFKKLWQDYISAQPKIPAVYDRLKRVVQITPEVLPALFKSARADVQILARSAIAQVLNVRRYDPRIDSLADRYTKGDWSRLEREHPDKWKMHPLEDVLRQAVSAGITAGELDSWKVIAWVNAQCPDQNDVQKQLAKSLFASPVWQTLSFEARFAVRQWFKDDVMTPGQIASLNRGSSWYYCRALRELEKDADVATTVAALDATMAGMKQSPVRVSISGLEKLGQVTDAVFTEPTVQQRILDLLGSYRLRCAAGQVAFGERLLSVLLQQLDPVDVQRVAVFLWSIGNQQEQPDAWHETMKLTQSLVAAAPAAANALASVGLSVCHPDGRDQEQWLHENGSLLKSLVGRTSIALGLVTIPVPVTHPAYPIYKAQSEWITGQEDTAWELLNDNWAELIPVNRKLYPDFMLWVLGRTMETRERDRMSELVKALLSWADSDQSTWGVAKRIDLDIAYGDIAMQLGKLDQARRIFSDVRNNSEYADTIDRYKATLRLVKVDRFDKRFEAALETLAELDAERIPEMWVASRYARAEVYYDMGEYDDAADDIASVLSRDPNHADATILQGNVFLRHQKLLEASELDLGSKGAQDTMVPGEILKLTLIDPTLEVSGASTEIEVMVWTTSGDKEHVLLAPFGDQKTKFRGEVLTALGAPNPDDRVLQVIGNDEIRYAYSEQFLKKMPNLDAKPGGPITVRSDAQLMVSSRALLSPAEQQVADSVLLMTTLQEGGLEQDRKEALAIAVTDGSGDGRDRGGREAEQAAAGSLKPGGNINVRVIDPDASRTAEIDEVTVRARTSSGDEVAGVVLNETGTHTGWFEGTIPTASAQASAMAANTAPGLNPNMVISPRTDYPAWRPVSASGQDPQFTVDLNDNVELGSMTITANESGAELKDFMLRTGMNRTDLRPVAAYPRNNIVVSRPWHPSVTVTHDTDAHFGRAGRSVYELDEIRDHLERQRWTQKNPASVALNVTGPSEAMKKSIPENVKWRQQRVGRRSYATFAHVIYRFQGYFYEPRSVNRRFKLDLGTYDTTEKGTGPSGQPEFLLAVDGEPITKKGAQDLAGQIRLDKGLHRFEIWGTGWVNCMGFGRSVSLLANLDPSAPGKMVDCPDSLFDPDAFPAGTVEPAGGRAEITKLRDGFKVSFAPGTRARIINLIFKDQEGPVPALNRIGLTSRDGQRVLPVKNDFATLSKNRELEVLPGDIVTVLYHDERYLNRERAIHERKMYVRFTDGKIGFADPDSWGRWHKGSLAGRLIRFLHHKPLEVVVLDPDADESVQPDKLNVTLRSLSGGEKVFAATEINNSAGQFKVTVVPVPGQATKPNEFQVGVGELLTVSYRDQENVDPGVPIIRRASIEHAVYVKPVVYLAHATVTPIDYKKFHSANPPPEPRPLNIGFASVSQISAESMEETREAEQAGLQAAQKSGDRAKEQAPVSGELIRPRWAVNNRWVDVTKPPSGGLEVIHGQPLNIEIAAPHLVLKRGSTVDVYLQTEAGREEQRLLLESLGSGDDAHKASPPVFDITVPGTIRWQMGVAGGDYRGFNDVYLPPQLPTYVGGTLGRSDGSEGERVPSMSLFAGSVPLVADFLPPDGALEAAELERGPEARQSMASQSRLVVRPDDQIYVGFRYEDDAGREQWLTGSATVLTHPVLDVMGPDYRETLESAYVGDQLYLRVVDLGADSSDAGDTIQVLLQAKSGAKHGFELVEVDSHSGVFKGRVELSYASEQASTSNTVPYDVKRNGFPVVYGDVMGVGYMDRNKQKAQAALLRIHRGADGTVRPFSKTFDDPKMASKTQFWLAEGYLEMAKNYRKLGETEKAADCYALAKDLLEKTMDMFREPDTLAQAEYLLGNLTQEEASATTDPDLAQTRYRAALSRYMQVTGKYPDTEAASKAQFKLATVYEALKEPEIAAQEYGKLAYKYPNSEFLALAMGRLGMHFRGKAGDYEKQAKELLAKQDDKEAQFQGRALEKMYIKEYLNSAELFSRLQERFPDHEMAGKSGLLAGQAFMRANQIREAASAFKSVFEHEAYDGPDVRAQAMYWAGKCYETLNEVMAAYAIYKRLTYDFPESQWAAYARGQLSGETLKNIDQRMEANIAEEKRVVELGVKEK